MNRLDLTYLRKVAFSLGLEVLVEVHNSEELERVLRIEAKKVLTVETK